MATQSRIEWTNPLGIRLLVVQKLVPAANTVMLKEWQSVFKQ